MDDERFDPIHLLYLDERGKHASKCEDVECPGWFLDPVEAHVVRCRDCKRFKDDRSAQGHVRRALKKGASFSDLAESIRLNAWSDDAALGDGSLPHP